MDAVEKYRVRRDERLRARGYRVDDEEETNEQSSSSKGGGGHGNTKLPFGLCQREGIEVGEDWTPKDAWDALAEKGITPENEYAKRSGGTFTLYSKPYIYKNVRPISKKTEKGNRYYLQGDLQDWRGLFGIEKGKKDAICDSFYTKDEMYAYLKRLGFQKTTDPDTGKIVNIKDMDIPKVVGWNHDYRFKEITMGLRGVDDIDGWRFPLVGKTFNGKRIKLKEFKSPNEAFEYAKKWYKCDKEDIGRTKYLSGWADKGELEKYEKEYARRHPGHGEILPSSLTRGPIEMRRRYVKRPGF